MRPQSTINPLGWFTSTLQTNRFSALIALMLSLILSSCGGGGDDSQAAAEPGPDGIAPTLNRVSIFNSFNMSGEVALGEKVKLEIEASESIMKPSVTIGGRAAEVSGQHHAWSAVLTMDESDIDGEVTFSISFVDVSGVAGVDVTGTTDGSTMMYCAAGCPDESESQGIAGDWKLAPAAGALGVGASQGDTSWWASGEADVTARACLFDDIYRFGSDGSFANVMGTETWLEAWQGAATDSCGTPVTPHDGSHAATYTYDEAAATLTVDGLGAHLGLAKVYNGGELSDPSAAVSSIVYTISAMTDTSMTLDIQIAGGWWQFKLVKD